MRIYNLGFVVFAVASIALSVDPLHGSAGALWLIAWRVVQGIGAAMLFANSAAILTDAFPADQRGLALGVNQVAAIAGSFIGLVLGGVLSEWDWRAVFWVSVPIALVGSVWSYRSLREVGERHDARLDWWGNITFAVGLGVLLAAITYGIEPYGGHVMGWTNPWVLAGLVGGVVLLVAVLRDRDQGRRPDVRDGAVPDPRVLGRQPRRAARGDGPRRHAVHAHHLAAGDLAAAARVLVREHAAVGRHLHAAADGRLPGRRARPPVTCPTGSARGRSRSAGRCWWLRRSWR